MMTAQKILGRVSIIGAGDATTEQLTGLLSDQGYTISTVADARDLAITSRPPPDVVVVDARTHLPQALDILTRIGVSGAREHAVIMLLGEDPVEEAVFIVRDDGIGFDPQTPSTGLGLRSMQERAAKIGARLTLSSQPGQGTLVAIRIPQMTTGGEPRV